MKDSKVHLLYDTAEDTLHLLRGTEDGLVWEYLDKNKFTIVYRAQSVGVGVRSTERSVEGILFQRSSSMSTIEDFFLARRSPLIKPLLSETEITRLQKLQDQCRRKYLKLGGRKDLLDEGSSDEGEQSELLPGRDLRSYIDRDKNFGIALSQEDKPKAATFIGSRDKRMLSAGSTVLAIGKKVWRYQTNSDYKKDSKITEKPLVKNKFISNVKGQLNPQVIIKSSKQSKKTIKAKTTEKAKIFKYKHVMKEDNSTKKEPENGFELLKEEKTRNKKHLDDLNVKNKSKKLIKRQLIIESDDEPMLLSKNKKVLSTVKSKIVPYKTGNPSDPSMKSELTKPEDIGKKKKHLGDLFPSKLKKQDKIPSTKTSDEKDEALKSDKILSDQQDKNKTSRVPGRRKKQGNNSDHEDIAPMAKTTEEMEGKGDSEEKFIQKLKKEKFSPSKVSVASRTTKGKKQLSALGSNKRERQSSVHSKVRKCSSIGYIIHYVLSNPVFIKKGWTLKHVDPTVSQLVTFRTTPAHAQSYW